jgi:rhodanese-related sulfurtransferase
MRKILGQILLLGSIAVVLGLGRNMVAPGGIAWVGSWPEVSVDGDSIVPPPSAQKDDPPLLTFAEARARFQDPDAIFLDAREPEDYAAGHIARSLLLPFEQFDTYWPAVEGQLPKDRDIVIYCSGAECELSLFLARHLRGLGYGKVSVFYGGWLKWLNEKMPIDSGQVST